MGGVVMRLAVVLKVLSCLVVPLISPVVLAQNQLSLGELRDGELVLNLSATEQQEVAQDTLNVSLEFSVQGRDQVALQNLVNSTLKKAVDAAKTIDSLQVHTGYYQVYQVQNEPGIFSADNPVWRAQQSMQLSSFDSPALLALVADLQTAGLTLSNLYYSLSTARYEQAASELTTQVLQTLQQRAENAGSALGKRSAALVEVNLDGNANVQLMREGMTLATRAVDVKMAIPAAEPGETTVSVTVTARAILSP